MTLEERGVSTLALLTVIRFLASELSQVVQQADGFDRSRRGSRQLNGEPETDDELLLQLSSTSQWKPKQVQQGRGSLHDREVSLGDAVVFMQDFFRTGGQDSLQQRWARNMLRLQKELMGQKAERRRAKRGHVAGGDGSLWGCFSRQPLEGATTSCAGGGPSGYVARGGV